MIMGHADQIIDLYQRHALAWDTERDRKLVRATVARQDAVPQPMSSPRQKACLPI